MVFIGMVCCVCLVAFYGTADAQMQDDQMYGDQMQGDQTQDDQMQHIGGIEVDPESDLGKSLTDLSKFTEEEKAKMFEAVGAPSTGFGGWRIAAYIIFGAIGWVALIYGKKAGLWKPMVIGFLLMVYPYFVSQVVLIYGVGILLTAALYFFRE